MSVLLQTISQRFSCRSYESNLPTEEQMQYIRDCVRKAPSAVNRQPWHFYILTKPEDLDKIAQCYRRDWIRTAPMVIMATVLHDEEWVRKWDGKAHGNIDIAIAVEHLCLAAAEQGLGTCWVCAFDTQLCHELFALPENEEASVLIPIGTPTAEALAAPRSERKAMADIFVEL